MFNPEDLGFEPGIYANRSARASKRRWSDGNWARFPDGVPQQMGGFLALSPLAGDTVTGRAREWIAWRPASQVGRFSIIGTHTGAFLFDGSAIDDVTPVAFTVGRPDSIIGLGYGAGPYGEDDYGTARTGLSGNVLDASVWTSGMFGETVIMCFNLDGKIYEFTYGTDATLVPVTNAPTANAASVSDERHVFAFGADGDPTKVQWSHREDRNTWIAAPGNRAGGYQMQNQTAFQTGRPCRGQMLAWTQTELFAFAPLNNSLIYDREKVGSNCGVMGPQSVCIVTDARGETAYWMGPTGFFTYDGLLAQLDSELQDYVFNDINLIQRAKFQARSNKLFFEVWFFYCSAESNEVNRAVVYDYRRGTWTKANMLNGRVCWLDVGIFNLPFGIDPDCIIYEHEHPELNGDGEPLEGYVLSHTFTIGNGGQGVDVDGFLPDLTLDSGTCALTIFYREVRNGDDLQVGPIEFEPGTEKVEFFLTARDMQLQISGVTGPWELGLPQLSMATGSGR